MSQSTPLTSPTTASVQVVLAGTTLLAGDSVGGVPSTVQKISGLEGWALDETTGSAKARVRIWDGTGTGAGNYQLADIEIPQGDSKAITLESPLQVRNNALYLEIVSGSVAGDIYWL